MQASREQGLANEGLEARDIDIARNEIYALLREELLLGRRGPSITSSTSEIKRKLASPRLNKLPTKSTVFKELTSRSESLLRQGGFIDEGLGTLRTETLKALNRYASLSCYALCCAILTKLPREIRDLIYQFIFDNVFTNEICSSFPTNHAQTRYSPGSILYQLSLDDPALSLPYASEMRSRRAHCWNPNYIPLTMRCEIATLWYTTTTFGITGSALSTLAEKEFFERDEWKLNIVPKDLRLNFRIPFGAGTDLCQRSGCIVGHSQISNPEDGGAKDSTYKKKKERLVLDHLEVLYLLRPGSRIEVTFSDRGATVNKQTIEVARPILERLRNKGYKLFTSIEQIKFCGVFETDVICTLETVGRRLRNRRKLT
ncbi:hypothetical protein B0J11DRAFT_601789 [Dendryphion nanum]|uniref:Uncharacterized protein n=1 Tax=Dendryphion nanum TaxID=256645 RepID=A0A9P9CY90_9PLEO|nr:hypothetical protein B0J11DRAFT_601789 [Dendryphion nanum]